MQDNLTQLFNEVRLLFNTLVSVGDELHQEEGISMGMRGVLEFLERQGPTSVPTIARSRNVSRQNIQVMVNALRKQKLLKELPNPAHANSPLLGLSESGDEMIQRMNQRETDLIMTRTLPLPSEKIETAIDVLKQVRATIRSD